MWPPVWPSLHPLYVMMMKDCIVKGTMDPRVGCFNQSIPQILFNQYWQHFSFKNMTKPEMQNLYQISASNSEKIQLKNLNQTLTSEFWEGVPSTHCNFSNTIFILTNAMQSESHKRCFTLGLGCFIQIMTSLNSMKLLTRQGNGQTSVR